MKTNEKLTIETVKALNKNQLEPGKMYVRINDIAYIHTDTNRDLFREMAGLYLEVETSHLFNNQYNTHKLRIFDRQVSEVINDVRENWCKCKYCGAMVKVGEEATHIETKKAKVKNCVGCFWYQKKYDFDKRIKEITIENQVEIEIEKTTFSYSCTFKGETDCTHSECDKYGFEYFTKQNCYFLKYPKGLPKIKTEKLTKEVKVGSYTLEYIDSLEYFRLRNGRHTINFKYDFTEKKFFEVGLGNTPVKKLDILDKYIKPLYKALENYPVIR